jgi:hypothetical protein
MPNTRRLRLPPKLRTVGLVHSSREVCLAPGVGGADLRVGYDVQWIKPSQAEHEIIKVFDGRVATAEVVCVAEATGIPNEYLLRIAGRRKPVLLKLDHALALGQVDRRPVTRSRHLQKPTERTP